MQDHSGDGGGGGAGGGGADGGKGGAGGSGDNTGQGGYSQDTSLFQTGGSSAVASGVTPGGTGEAYYVAGTSVGGNPAAAGSNGYAVVVFNIGVQANVKVSGAWKEVNDYVHQSIRCLETGNSRLCKSQWNMESIVQFRS